tara:strand:+ start:976 stop:1233 length:258 start_codon:yes stop_codon:yes gene_type:complete
LIGQRCQSLPVIGALALCLRLQSLDLFGHARPPSAGEAQVNRTRAERERDTLFDTPRGAGNAKYLKILEVGTGIEPVFTDLQSGA